ncbi:MAG: hypothetical protein QXD84_07750 [Thermoplasmata archaeon]
MELVEIQPCTEEGLVTLEAWLGGRECAAFFDPVLLCRLLLASPFFESIRCSDQMGYGIAERGGQRVHVFRTGKLIVRRAPGRESAMEALRLTGRCLWGAMVRASGRTVLDELLTGESAGELPPPPGSGDITGGAALGLGEALRTARALPSWKSVEGGLEILRTLLDELASSGEAAERAERQRRAEAHFLDFAGGAEDARPASVALVFLALSLSLERAAAALEAIPADDRKGMWAAMAEVLEAVASGRASERNRLEERILVEAGEEELAPEVFLAPLNLLSVRLPGPGKPAG